MFCTEECREKAYSSFPDISCMISLSEDNTSMHIQVAQLLAQAESAFHGHENLIKYIKTNDYKTSKKTIFDYDFSDQNDQSYDMNRMKAALSLISQVYKVLMREVQKETKEVAKGNKHLEEFLKHTCGVFIKNTYYFRQFDILVMVTLPIGSLFNHSCLANISYIDNNGTAVFYVTRPIKAGEQLFNNYL